MCGLKILGWLGRSSTVEIGGRPSELAGGGKLKFPTCRACRRLLGQFALRDTQRRNNLMPCVVIDQRRPTHFAVCIPPAMHWARMQPSESGSKGKSDQDFRPSVPILFMAFWPHGEQDNFEKSSGGGAGAVGGIEGRAGADGQHDGGATQGQREESRAGALD